MVPSILAIVPETSLTSILRLLGRLGLVAGVDRENRGTGRVTHEQNPVRAERQRSDRLQIRLTFFETAGTLLQLMPPAPPGIAPVEPAPLCEIDSRACPMLL